MNTKKIIPLLLLSLLMLFGCKTNLRNPSPIANGISTEREKSNFLISSNSGSIPIIVDNNDYPGVQKIAKVFSEDIEKVTGKVPSIATSNTSNTAEVIIIGTLGNSSLIDSLATSGKIKTEIINGKWETSLVQIVDNPFPNIKRAMVIAGSDKRGTIYGMFSLSRAMGVSPWYWWADVPTEKQQAIYMKPGIYSDGTPKVKYRGIFLNDEAPALSGWVYEKYGEFNSKFYYKVFELILRLKGNYLWPAMWGRAFNFNDTLNPVLAHELGIVMGTSHHEPMLRAQKEWHMFGEGAWNYNTNQAILDSFWTQGIANMKDHESIITIGMRGDGDEPMSEESNIALLEKIVKNQRKIISNITGKPASEQPQIWALYKEVLDYYDKGMRVPDDVTLLLCDDNWGNIRRLPNQEELKHTGGYGIYYHYDYVGGPRNYKWLNVTQISRVWEQMNLAYQHDANKIWIVNVGDLKPMELPISFFLDYAWNPENYSADDLPEYTISWAKEQFGSKYSKQIANLLNGYTNYNSRRTPEMLSPETYSLSNYREFEYVVNDYNKLANEAEKTNAKLNPKYRDAFYQLVLYPIKACANLNELYYTTALNHLYAKQNRSLTNQLAEKVTQLFNTDSLLSLKYNKEIANGKWNHFMDQTHIGYTYWQQPKFNIIPETSTIEIANEAKMGVAAEGTENWWPAIKTKLSLPEFNPYGQSNYYIEVYNQGLLPFNCTLKANKKYIKLSRAQLEITNQERIEVSIDWGKAPKNKSEASIKIESNKGETAIIYLNLNKIKYEAKNAFIASNGVVSIEAENFTTKHESESSNWQVIPNLGKTGSAVTAIAKSKNIVQNSDNQSYLEYNFYTSDTGWVDIYAYLSPTLDFKNKGGLQFGLAFNKGDIEKINMHTQATSTNWYNWVGNQIIQTKTKMHIEKPGFQSLKFYNLDFGVVLQKLVINQGAFNPSYLGPPESYFLK